MNWRYQAVAAPGDTLTDMPGLALYPEGLYKVCVAHACL